MATATNFLTTLNNYRHQNSSLNLKNFVNWGSFTSESEKHSGINGQQLKTYISENTFHTPKELLKIDLWKGNPSFILNIDNVKQPLFDPLDITRQQLICKDKKSINKMLANLLHISNGEYYYEHYKNLLEFHFLNEKNMILFFYKNHDLLNLIGIIGYFLINFETTNSVIKIICRKLIKKLEKDPVILSYIPFDNQKTIQDIIENNLNQLILGYNLLKIYINSWHIIYASEYGKNVISEFVNKLDHNQHFETIQKNILCINNECTTRDVTSSQPTESIIDSKSKSIFSKTPTKTPTKKEETIDTTLLSFVKQLQVSEISDNLNQNSKQLNFLNEVITDEESNLKYKNIYLISFCVDALTDREINDLIEIDEKNQHELNYEDIQISNILIQNIHEKKHSFCLYLPDKDNNKFYTTSYIFQNKDGIITITNDFPGINIEEFIPDLAEYIENFNVIDNNLNSLVYTIKKIKQFLHI